MTIQSQTQIDNLDNITAISNVFNPKILKFKPKKTKMTERRLLSNATSIEAVWKMVKHQELVTPRDFYFAGVILERGHALEDYALAYLLALHANNMGYENVPNTPHPLAVAASARDKWLLSMGQPQDFGTQKKLHSCGIIERQPTNPNISDSERERFHVPRLTWISR